MEKRDLDTPIGILRLFSDDKSLKKIQFSKGKPVFFSNNPILLSASDQLTAYFTGHRRKFDLPLDPDGTGFQRRVWSALQQIPYGSTVTYRQLSERLGDPQALRAVGKANGSNPIPVIIPCHRVIGADNRLVGYSGGIERKKWLLKHEGALLL